MALQAFNYGTMFPDILVTSTSGSLLFTFDGGDDAIAHIFSWPKTCSIKKVKFVSNTVTSWPANGVKVQFETVGAAGLPTGTLIDANATYTQASAWGASSVVTITFATAFSVTQGDVAALTFRCANVADTPNFRIRYAVSQSTNQWNYPYCASITSGTSWGKVAGATPIFGLEDSLGNTFAPFGVTLATVHMGTEAFNSGSSPAKRGMRIYLPFAATVHGAYVSGFPAAGGDFALNLYNAAGSLVVGTGTIDGDVVGTTSSGGLARNVFPFTADTDLAVNTEYNLILEPSTANNFTVGVDTISAVSDLAYNPGSTDMYAVSLSGTTFTQVTTKRYMMGLIINKFSDNVGSGGGLVLHNGMTGGING